MCETKIEKKDLDERPILFVIKVIDERYLKLFYFIQALREFRNNKET
jgi:hypothetical protein